MSAWHLITGEYPPQPGGVSDHTRLLARGLARAGDEVHVWAPAAADDAAAEPGVTVHRLPGRFGAASLARLDAALRRAERPFRLLVQYVPHMYGWRAMNLPFCAWLLGRRRWRPWVLFHEVAFPMRSGQPLRHNALGGVNRLMAGLVLRAAERVFVSTPAWEPLLRRLAPLRRPPTWLPVPSGLALEADPAAVAALRRRLPADPAALVLGHFSTFGGATAGAVAAVLPRLLGMDPGRVALLVGRGGPEFAGQLLAAHPGLAGRVHAPGGLPPEEAALHLRACDLLLQPYPDGATGRRTTLMAGLALGLPVVTTRGPLTEPLWEREGLAVLVPAGDAAALADAAERLAADRDARRRLGERGRAGYLRYFSLDRTVEILRGQEGEGARRACVCEPRNAIHLSAPVPRLAVVCDYPEEGWPSMDLVGEMLLRELRAGHAAALEAMRVCPPFRRRAGRLPGLGGRAFNADRLLNRLWDYPRHLRRRRCEFDVFHLCDHSYAHLVHALPPGRAGVFCHDLDAFRCLLEPGREPRPRWFRAVARHVLSGMRKAAVVFCATRVVRGLLQQYGLVDPARLVLAPYGAAAEFVPHGAGGTEVTGGRPYVLHVGSCVARKRVDVLLEVFAALRHQFPELALVQVGGVWTAAQRQQMDRLGIGPAAVQVRGLPRADVARLYRGAAVVLQPSAAEGFGLPVVEALACGAPVVASDLPVLREVGGAAAVYCPVGDVAAWHAAAARLLTDPAAAPAREDRLAQARRYSWAAQARTIAGAYRRLVGS